MARNPKKEAARVYPAIEQFVERCLRRDDSLFTPGRAIWSARWAQVVKSHFVDNGDAGPDTFMEKLGRQLATAPDEAIQLLAEMVYVYFLPADSVRGVKKRAVIHEILAMCSKPVDIPDDLASALDGGIWNPGMSFNSHRYWHIYQLIAFTLDWKALTDEGRERMLREPSAFKEFVFAHEIERANGQRHALLHLVHPDAFEDIVSNKHKLRLAEAFAEHVDDEHADLDEQLLQIRKALDSECGGRAQYYRSPLKEQWLDKKVTAARRRKQLGVSPESAIERCLPDETQRAKILEAFARSIEQAHARNPESWSVTLGVRGRLIRLNVGPLRAFDLGGDTLGVAVLGDAADQAVVGLDGVEVPAEPFKRIPEARDALIDRDAFARVWPKLADAHRQLIALAARHDTQYSRSHSHEFIEYLSSVVGRELPNRPGGHTEDADPVDGAATSAPAHASLSDLEDELLLETGALERIEELLQDKRQVVFHGPPGTGKTYIARKLAAHLAGAGGRVQVVQFHPSYAYEDFVEGFRPAIVAGQPGFELVEGPLKRIAREALAAPDATFVLVIDELNRGNVAKVFGELYFLLEYRDEQISLQYSREPFALPQNLLILGTMNTADRSIALVDLALRRRFHFAPFFPDRAPIKGVLRRWLARHTEDMGWVADVVEHANRLIEDRHVAIGPSHFMNADMDEDWVEMIWEHSVLPYLEEQFFGQDERLREFQLDRLRGQVRRAAGAFAPGDDRGASFVADGPAGESDLEPEA